MACDAFQIVTSNGLEQTTSINLTGIQSSEQHTVQVISSSELMTSDRTTADRTTTDEITEEIITTIDVYTSEISTEETLWLKD